MTRFNLALALPVLLLSTSAMAGVPGWTMSEASGQVMVASSGMVRAASRGATLSAGDVISTGAKGRAVIVRGEEYLVVAPNSRIRVADPAKSGGMTQIIEQIGNVVFKIKKMATPHFAVETPFLAAVVKGTTFSVTVTETGASVQVIEGRVEVETRDGGARYLVLPGDIGSVSGKALGRLNVQGRETKTLVSPNEGRGVTVPTAEILNEPAPAIERPVATEIATAVGEPPVRLAVATEGMVSGALIAAAASSSDRTAASAESRPAAGATNGNPESTTGGNPSPSAGEDASSTARPAETPAPAVGDNGNAGAAAAGNGADTSNGSAGAGSDASTGGADNANGAASDAAANGSGAAGGAAGNGASAGAADNASGAASDAAANGSGAAGGAASDAAANATNGASGAGGNGTSADGAANAGAAPGRPEDRVNGSNSGSNSGSGSNSDSGTTSRGGRSR